MCFTFSNPCLIIRQAVYCTSGQASPEFSNIVYIKKMQTPLLIYNKSVYLAAPKSVPRIECAEIHVDSSCHRARNNFHTL